MAKQPKAFSPSGYYRVRLEHTLKHTQQMTRLIYLVNGGALGLLYFSSKMTELGDYKKYVPVVILGTLAFINGMHSLLIIRQGEWYKLLDDAFALTSSAREKDVEMERPKGMGTHGLYATLHAGLAMILVIAAGLVLRISN